MDMKVHTILPQLRRLPAMVLGTLFLLTAIYKMVESGSAIKMIAMVPWIPGVSSGQAYAILGAVVGLELYVGISFFFRSRIPSASWASICMLTVFSLAVAPVFMSTGGSCGCAWKWMPIEAHSALGLVTRNVALIALCLAAIVGNRLVPSSGASS